MRQRRVGTRSGDGGEGDVLQQAGLQPLVLQCRDGVDLGEAALRRLAREPRQIVRHCHAVAQVGSTGACKLGRVLARLHQGDRIGAGIGRATGIADQGRQG